VPASRRMRQKLKTVSEQVDIDAEKLNASNNA
jgi:hypothetical protein